MTLTWRIALICDFAFQQIEDLPRCTAEDDYTDVTTRNKTLKNLSNDIDTIVREKRENQGGCLIL